MNRTTRHWLTLIFCLAGLQVLMLVSGRIPGFNEIVLVENRTLHTWPEMPDSLQTLDKFGAAVDAYVTDRFPARRVLISALNYVRYVFGYSGTPKVFVGGDGWLFYDNGDHFAQLRPSTLTQAEVKVWVDTLQARTKMLAIRGAIHLLIAPPVKEHLYSQRIPDWMQDRAATITGDADVLAAASKHAGLNAYLDLRAPLAMARAAGVAIYSPYDTHWTGEGAYIAYATLMQELQRYSQVLGVRTRQGFSIRDVPPQQQARDLAHMLGIGSLITQNHSELDDLLLSRSQHTEYLSPAHDWTADRVIHTGQAGPVLLITGDSFSTALLPLLSGHFSKVIFTHHQNGFFRQDLIERFKPDIVLLEVIESGLRYAMQPTIAATASDSSSSIAPGGWKPTTAIVNVEALAAKGHATYQCNLERLHATRVQSGSVISAGGWMADVAGGKTATAMELILQQNGVAWAMTVPIAQSRPDVAQYFNKPGLVQSGFSTEASATALPDGEYQAFLRMSDASGDLVCVTMRHLRLPAATAGG